MLSDLRRSPLRLLTGAAVIAAVAIEIQSIGHALQGQARQRDPREQVVGVALVDLAGQRDRLVLAALQIVRQRQVVEQGGRVRL